MELELYTGLGELPPDDCDRDREPAALAVARLRASIAPADGVLIAAPEYKPLDPGRAQERARRGLAPVP